MTGTPPLAQYKKAKKLEETRNAVVYLLEASDKSKLIQKKALDNSIQFNELISREYRILTQFQHPHIVRVLDYDIDKEGRAFFTSEYIDGKPIGECFKGFTEDFIAAFLQVFDALGAFHNKGFIHSDLKPEHVLYDTVRKKATLIDFGFAGIACGDSPGAGTIGYIAPEVLKGIGLDQRSDLYSLGIIMYEILSGIKPYKNFQKLDRVPEELNSYLDRLIAPEPYLRPALPELHEYFRKQLPSGKIESMKYDVDIPVTGYVENPEIKMRTDTAAIINPFVICGDTGAGKTRHLREIKYRLQTRGWQVLWHIGKGNISLLAALRDFLGIPDDDNSRDYHPQNKIQAYEEIRQAIAEYASRSGLGILVDDLEDCSDFELGLLRYIGLGAAGSNLLVAASANTVGDITSERVKQTNFDMIGLELFSMPEIEQLLAKTFFVIEIQPSESGIHEFAGSIMDMTSGNPLFIVETFKALHEKQALVFRDNKWQVNMALLKQTEMPSKTENILTMRIKDVGDDELLLLKLLAICECPLSMAMINDLVPGRGEINLERLKNSGLVRIEHTAHGIIAVVANKILLAIVKEMIPPQEQAQLVNKLIAAFESMSPMQAWHYAPVAALYEKSGRIPQAITYFQKAAEEAERIYDNDSAVILYEKLIGLSESKKNDQYFAFVLKAADLYDIAGNNARAQQRYDQALKTADPEIMARAYAGLAKVIHALGELSESLGLFDQALQRMSLGTEEYIRTANYKAYALFDVSEFDKARDILNQSVDSARKLKNHALEAESSYYMITMAWHRGNYDEGIVKSTELLSFCKTHCLEKQYAFVANLFTSFYLLKADYVKAMEFVDLAIAGFRKVKQADAVATAVVYKANILLIKGDLKSAQSAYEEVLKSEILHDNNEILKNCLLNLSLISRQISDLGQALIYARQAHDTAPDDPHAIYEMSFIQYLKGDLDAAQSQLENALSRSQNNLFYMNLAFIYLALGKLGEAKSVLAKALDFINGAVTNISDKTDILIRACEFYCLTNEFERALSLAEQVAALSSEHSIHRNITNVLVSIISAAMNNTDPQGFDGDLLFLKERGFISTYAFLTKLVCQIRLETNIEANNIEAILKDLYEIGNIYALSGAKTEFQRVQELKEKLYPVLVRDYSRHAVSQKYLATLSGIATLIHAKLGDPDFSNQVLDLIIKATGAERGALFIKSKKRMKLAAGRNLDKTTIKDAGDLSRTVISDIANREFVYIQDAVSDVIYNVRKSVMLNQIRTILCIPLTIDKEVLGAVYLDSRFANAVFSVQDKDFLTTVTKILASVLEKSTVMQAIEEENILLKSKIDPAIGQGYLIGRSKPMKAIYRQIEDIGPSNAPVLILGETGTGKGMIARYIHMYSRQKHNRFLTINCGTIPETLLESELFGHKKGAFTDAVSDKSGLLEQAHGGTIFLDEITNTSLSFQAKLLETIEDKVIRRLGETEQRKIDVRFLFATNKDLEIEVEEGRFRKDLYYRINVFSIHVPPLRERSSDIAHLARYFLKKYSTEVNKAIRDFTAEAMKQLKEYYWTGNVRELQNLIERAVVTSKGSMVSVEDIGLSHVTPVMGKMTDIKKEAIIEALNASDGNVTLAAKMLHISRRTIERHIKKYNVIT
ncbi:MAG TPA: sigma 54-interacting transcriptional regulator [bacterium]